MLAQRVVATGGRRGVPEVWWVGVRRQLCLEPEFGWGGSWFSALTGAGNC